MASTSLSPTAWAASSWELHLDNGTWRCSGGSHARVGHVLGNEDLVEQRSAEWLVDHMVEREASCAGPVDPGAPAFVKAASPTSSTGRRPTTS